MTHSSLIRLVGTSNFCREDKTWSNLRVSIDGKKHLEMCVLSVERHK